uniref:BRCA2 DNA repair associated n=1 Tax=Sphaeramia orbicularis TaxID=375764 RepID=A0A673CBD9_9TELE
MTVDLGPLDPNWFDVLTAEAFTNDGSEDQDDLCANQEGNFKTPHDKTAVESQLFSTPKVFRHSRIVSPEMEDDHSFTLTFPLCMFLLKQTVFAKRITESLGAQMNHDISWTSSLNTPPIVRKLFPSLSNASRVKAVSPKNNLNETLQTSVNQSDGVWKQKLPDAIEDEEVRSTVASVLDGAENALSIFFTNSSSALRKVKTERIKRRQIIPTKEDDSGSMDLQNSSASNEQRTADQEPGKVPLSPHVKKTANTEIVGSTQWSPLSLSEIPHISVDTSCHVDVTGKLSDTNILPEQPLSYSDSGKLVKQYLKMTDSGITKKKRCFVYTVKSSKLPQNVPDEAKRWSINKNISEEKNLIQKCENVTEENLPPTAHLDMSQLCIAFAQDFSQMSDPVKRSSVAEDAVSNDFSPSACLSALKRAKQKTRQERLHRDCEDVSNNGLMSAINQNISISEGTISDSGFQSAVTEITHMTVSLSALPCSERDGQQKTNFQTQINKMCHFPPKNTGNGQVSISDSVQKAEMCAELPATVTECKTLGSDGESKLNSSKQLSSSAGGDGGRMNCLSSERTVSLPSALASGFKTASNKALHISSASLEKAKHLFDETGDERTLTDQPPICSGDIKNEFSISNGLKKDTTCNSNNPLSNGKLEDISCHLTASQKADVRELCSLLEEADSQFEFTQFKTTNLNQQCQDNGISSQKADKELDPDFLNGIDFDDSFSSDAEKSLPVKMTFDKYHTSDITSKPSDISLSVVMSKENFNVAGHDEMNKADNKSSSLFCEGFKTARGSVLKVSKTCLSKARALFADLEANSVIDKKLIDVPLRKSEQRNRGFLAASGKSVAISTEALQKAKALFDDISFKAETPAASDTTDAMPEHGQTNTEKILKGFKTAGGAKVYLCDDGGTSTNSLQRADDCIKQLDVLHSSDNVSEKPPPSFLPQSTGSGFCTASGKKVSVSDEAMTKAKLLLNENPTFEEISTKENALPPHNSSFKTASGKGVIISPAALNKAKCLLNECDETEDKSSMNRTHSKPTVNTLPPKNSGFQTAAGKRVTVSVSALQKAQSFLSEFNAVGDETSLKQTYPKVPVNDAPPRNNGFLSARGKPVAFSAEALQKAKALFDDMSFTTEMPAASDVKKNEEKLPNHTKKIHCPYGKELGQ